MTGLRWVASTAVAVAVAAGLTVAAAPSAVADTVAAPTPLLATTILSVASVLPTRQGAEPHEFDRSDITSWQNSTVSPSSVFLQVEAPAPAVGQSYLSADETFTMPGNAHFAPGTYADSALGGTFTVLDAAYTNGQLSRLHLTFLGGTGPEAFYGELQLGEPNTTPQTRFTARDIVWPSVPVGVDGGRTPFWIRNTSTSTATIGHVTATGDTADFPVLLDTCAGDALPAGASCEIVPAFAPTVAGARSATITVPVGTTTAAVQLAGSAPGGRTGLVAYSAPGDFVGGGQSWEVSDTSADWYFQGTASQVYANSGSWYLEFGVYPGQVITPGTYYPHAGTATGSTSGLEITAHHRGCSSSSGAVTVKTFTLDSTGAVTSMDFTFRQACTEDNGAALTGEFWWHAPGTALPLVAASVLPYGTSLHSGQSLVHLDSTAYAPYTLTLGADGNLVDADENGRPIWSTGTSGSGNTLTVSPYGSLQVRSSAGAVLWSSHTGGSGSADVLVLQSDGLPVLHQTSATGPVVWAPSVVHPY